jgi:ATP-binding cassette subfamily B protein
MPSGPEAKKWWVISPEDHWRRFLSESALLREYLHHYRKPVVLGLLCLVVVDVLEVLPPFFLKKAVDVVTLGQPLSWLSYWACAYVGVAVIQGLGRYGWRMYLIRASLLSGRDLRNRFTDHLFGLSARFFDRKPIGELMSLATSDVEAVRMTIGAGLLTLADALFYFLTVPIAMFLLSPKLMLLAFIPLPIIPALVMRNQREIHNRFEKVQESFSRISAMTQESLNGLRVTRAFAKEDVQLRRFRKIGEEHVRLGLHLGRVQAAFGPTLDFAMSLGLVFLLYVGGRALISESEFSGAAAGAALSLGTFVAFQRYIQKMVWPMAALGMALSTYQRSVSSSKRLQEVFDERSDVPENEIPQLPAGVDSTLARSSGWRTAGRVEFRNLSFRFPGSNEEVLKNITLVIEPGERIAFVGAIGAGKSALLSLLPRLYPVERAMLRIDGVDVNDWPLEVLRSQVGYVSQDVFLFSESVLENIAYGLHEWAGPGGKTGWGPTVSWNAGAPQAAAPIESIEQATQLAGVHEDVLGLSGSYATRLGERGVNLSGGQKQRLTIARAIVKKPAILVLDDALSSVDVQTEEKILRGLRARPGRNTEIISAHRISTIQDADRIVVLENGGIHQLGTHQALLSQRSGLYRQFYEQQMLKADLESYSAELDRRSSFVGGSGEGMQP